MWRHGSTSPCLGKQVRGALEVPGVEVLRVDPARQGHPGELGGHLGDHRGRAELVEVLEQPAHEVADQVDAERPAVAEVPEDPDHVGHPAEHHPPPPDGVGEVDGHPVDVEGRVAEDVHVEARRGDDEVRLELGARGEPEAASR